MGAPATNPEDLMAPQYELGKMPWRYECHGDSDGETAGYDHFVLDADGHELAVVPNEEIGRLMAASVALRVCWQHVPAETACRIVEMLKASGGAWVEQALAELPQLG